MPRLPLQDWTLVSLRPVGQHSATRRAVAAAGGRCVAISTVRLQATTPDDTWEAALRAPVRVFTSPAAVRAVCRHACFSAKSGQRDVAVGRGTARALRHAGGRAPIVPEVQNSEGVLALPLWRTETPGRVGLLTAPGGRGLLRPRLAELGWQVAEAQVYRREPVAGLASRLLRVPTGDRVAWLVSSAEAFEAVWAEATAAQRAMMHRHIVVVASDRLAQHVRVAGCMRLLHADAPQPRAMVAAVAAAVSRKLWP